MKTRKFVIPPGEPFEIAVQGDYVRVKQSAVDLLIENADAGESVELSEGEDFDFSMFKTLRISHENGAAQTVKITISKGKRGGSAKVGGAVSVNNFPASPANQGAFVNAQETVTNASTAIVAANANRRYLLIQNNDAAGIIYVRLDGGVATAATGIKIMPGGSMELRGYVPTGAITAIGSIANNVNVVSVEG